MLRIAVDVTPNVTGATGIARYVAGLAGALDARHDVTVARFAVGRGPHAPPAGTRHLSVPLRLVARSWAYGGPPTVEHLVGPVDSVHASGPVVPSSRAAAVTVVHDLAGLDRPDLHPARTVRQLRAQLRAVARCDAVIAVSQATADALTGRGVPAALIHVVALGVRTFPPAVEPQIGRRPYVLAVGSPVPRKAYGDLLRAMARLPPSPLALVIVGPPATEDRALERLAAELGITDRYHRAGWAPDAELAGWYAGASALAAPSIDEGFGLPVVEAQAAGVPVVASDIAAHREVSGGAATLMPVGDVDALRDALAATVARGPEIEAAVTAGRANAARYTWEACAEATLAVHRSVGG